MIQTDVLRCESRFTAAVINADRSAAEAILAEDFTAVGFAGNSVKRAEYLAILFAAERRFTVFDTAEQKTIEAGDARLVTGMVTMVDASREANPPALRYVALYVCRGDEWRLRFWQETPVSRESDASDTMEKK